MGAKASARLNPFDAAVANDANAFIGRRDPGPPNLCSQKRRPRQLHLLGVWGLWMFTEVGFREDLQAQSFCPR